LDLGEQILVALGEDACATGGQCADAPAPSIGRKFPLPIQAFADKIQIPALPDFNAGICIF